MSGSYAAPQKAHSIDNIDDGRTEGRGVEVQCVERTHTLIGKGHHTAGTSVRLQYAP